MNATIAHKDAIPFLEAIKARPSDPLQRLIYADWLDESGRSIDAALQRVLAEPEKDEHRLAYADALPKERCRHPGVEPQSGLWRHPWEWCPHCHGTGEALNPRAEFIRVQLELAAIPRLEMRENEVYRGAAMANSDRKRFQRLTDRVSGLLGAHGEHWAIADVIRPGGLNVGGVERWVTFDGVSDRLVPPPRERQHGKSGRRARWNWIWRFAWRRGFVEHITLSAADWLAHADAICNATPIMEVTFAAHLNGDEVAACGLTACAVTEGRARLFSHRWPRHVGTYEGTMLLVDAK